MATDLPDGMKKWVKYLGRESYGFPSNYSVHDAGGQELKLWKLSDSGKLVPSLGEESYTKIRDVTLRDDDLLIQGYPKTGCHWIWETLSMIVNRKAQYTEYGKTPLYMELVKSELLDNWPPVRILNTHMWMEFLPKQMKEKKTKMIMTVRNPKDTAVSFYHHHLVLKFIYHYKGQFNDWFPLYMDGQIDYGSYWDFYKGWDKIITDNPDMPVLVVRYEDMKENPQREIRRMAEYVGVTLDDQLVEDIAQATEFAIMKKAFANVGSMQAMLRKGQVGDWKNWLTVAQSEMIDEQNNKLRGTRFDNLKYEL